jgi:G6PDH family F420-dependent oxidoreductase
MVAQAAATVAELFPGRLSWLALGSGQALSECMVTQRWPDKSERNQRLLAGAEVLRALWRGETVDRSEPVALCQAKLYCLPDPAPRLYGAALTTETAGWVGGWADGLITINQPVEQLDRLVGAFRSSGGDAKPMAIQVHLSVAANDEAARANAFDQWRTNTLPPSVAETLRSPTEFDEATRDVRPDDLDDHMHISADPARHAAWLQQYVDRGFEEIYLHNVGRNQVEFIQTFERSIKPLLRLGKTGDT